MVRFYHDIHLLRKLTWFQRNEKHNLMPFEGLQLLKTYSKSTYTLTELWSIWNYYKLQFDWDFKNICLLLGKSCCCWYSVWRMSEVRQSYDPEIYSEKVNTLRRCYLIYIICTPFTEIMPLKKPSLLDKVFNRFLFKSLFL